MRVYCYQIFLCSFLFICLSTASYGQDHYWSQQYGGPATLTGGTAVVGANDHSGLFYNPGALGFIDSVQVTASTFAFGFESMKLKNGAGNDLNLTGFRVNILPQLIATSINIKKAPKLKLVLGTLTRSRINIRLNQENENLYDVIKGAPGLE
ncbi:MAG: hypothetical protein IPP77_12210 [Bacteroidetes bacterium]|nr:hypothetical protein [Bacteroidota bacterium]